MINLYTSLVKLIVAKRYDRATALSRSALALQKGNVTEDEYNALLVLIDEVYPVETEDETTDGE